MAQGVPQRHGKGVAVIIVISVDELSAAERRVLTSACRCGQENS